MKDFRRSELFKKMFYIACIKQNLALVDVEIVVYPKTMNECQFWSHELSTQQKDYEGNKGYQGYQNYHDYQSYQGCQAIFT